MNTEAIKSDFENLLKQHLKEIKDGSKKLGIVYHYTTFENFLKIVEGESLKLTHTMFLNDPAELTYGFSFVRKYLLDQLELKKNQIDQNIFENTKNYIQEIFQHKQFEEKLPPYIFCLSKKSDSLNQWRAYGDDGMGVALGFDLSSLEHSLLTGEIFEIIYDSEAQYKILHEFNKQLTEVLFKHLMAGVDPKSNDYRIIADSSLYNFCCATALRFKHSNWSDEGEVRVAHFFNPTVSKLRFSAQRGSLIPVMEVNDWLLPQLIKDVKVGPKVQNFDLVKKSIYMLKQRHAGLNYEVSKSEIEYR